MTVNSSDLGRAVGEMRAILEPRVDDDWTVPAGGLDWDCWSTAAHIAHDLFAYAAQLAIRRDSAYLPHDLVARPTAEPRELLQSVNAAACLLRIAFDSSPPGTRAWHWGSSTPEGFVAMGIGEILVHTHDITRGLGVSWRLPADLCARVLEQVAVDAPSGEPDRVLLWYTGREPLDALPRRTSWGWRPAISTP